MHQSFQVQGMSCHHCVKAVTQAVRTVDPGAQVRVDLSSSRVDVDSPAARDALAEAIRAAGYVVSPA